MKMVVAGLLVMGAATPASASSADAWARFDREVAQRCIAASRLDAAQTSQIVGFDDTLGKVVTLVSGRETVRGRRGNTVVPVKKLCVYDQRSKRTWVQEVTGWSAPVRR